MENFLIILGVILIAIIAIYIAARLIMGLTIYSSKAQTSSDIEADQYYYLPGFSLSIKATALIEVVKTGTDKTIRSSNLVQLSLDPAVHIEPDTTEIIGLKYYGDWFSSDETQITVSPESLLQNISSTVEDRIGEIIGKITTAPQNLLRESLAILDVKPPILKTNEKVIIETLEVTRTFQIGIEQTMNKADVVMEWIIPIKGVFVGTQKPVDATFTIKNKNFKDRKGPGAESYNGFYSRLLTRREWEVKATGLKTPVLLSCFVPDISSVVKIPVTRSFFIKKKQTPKFSNGLLIENYISKPSEIEAMVSIPINIAKAIVSIPAQLFKFETNRNKLEKAYEDSLTELAKSRQAREDQHNSTLQDLKKELTQLKEQSKSTKQDELVQPPDENPAATDPVPELGKLKAPKPIAEKKTKYDIKKILSDTLETTALQGIVPPPDCLWNTRTPATWSDYNNRIGGEKNCVPAAAAHMTTCWTANAGTVFISELKDVQLAYERECERSEDTGLPIGCLTGNFMRGWIKEGIAGRKILDYRQITVQDIELLKKAILIYGPCMLGFDLPKTAQLQPEKWDAVVSTPTHSSNPGSWGGHAVAAIGYDNEGIFVISWGIPVKVTWSFFKKYNDEVFVAISSDWLTGNHRSPQPSDRDLASLQTTIDNLANA